MPKINIKVSVHNEIENTHYEVPAIIQEDTIKYKELDETISIYNYRENILVRENKELRMKYHFDRKRITQGEILVKELNQKMKLNIETKKIERKDQNIEIEFNIEGKSFLYRIEEIK